MFILHNILRENHWMAELYKTAYDVYEELTEEERLNFRMLIVDTTKRGHERTREGPNVTPVDINRDDLKKLKTIHPGRVSVATAAGNKLVAQVFYF